MKVVTTTTRRVRTRFILFPVVGIILALIISTYLAIKNPSEVKQSTSDSSLRIPQSTSVDDSKSLLKKGRLNKKQAKTSTVTTKQSPHQFGEKNPGEEILPKKENLQQGLLRDVTFPDGRILNLRLPKEGDKKVVFYQGERFEVDHMGNAVKATPPPIFKNPKEEQLVGMAVENGFFLPGLIKGMSDEEAVDLLLNPVVVKDDDPPDVIVKKEAVAELKQTALAYIQEGGGTFDDFVDEMASYASQERKLKGQGLRKLMQLLREGKVEEAQAFKANFDAVMTEQGFPALKLPKKLAEKME